MKNELKSFLKNQLNTQSSTTQVEEEISFYPI
jgi:hypothetical protein